MWRSLHEWVISENVFMECKLLSLDEHFMNSWVTSLAAIKWVSHQSRVKSLVHCVACIVSESVCGREWVGERMCWTCCVCRFKCIAIEAIALIAIGKRTHYIWIGNTRHHLSWSMCVWRRAFTCIAFFFLFSVISIRTDSRERLTTESVLFQLRET